MSKRVKFNIEIEVKSSPNILYTYLSSPSGLAEWFCDDVDVHSGNYIFKWDGSEQEAEVVKTINNKLVRFRWADSPEDEYFEMEVRVDDLTSDVALVITDFCDAGDERSSEQLWESQVQQLKMAIGS
ncbi:MAG: START-like domain-containing protein [Bacteroidia bacterium]